MRAREDCFTATWLISLIRSLLQEVYSALLKRMGFTNVSVAADGQQALDMIDKEPSFDICLMDCEMPVMSGPEYVLSRGYGLCLT